MFLSDLIQNSLVDHQVTPLVHDASVNWNQVVVILTLLPVQRLLNGSWSLHLGRKCWGKTKRLLPSAMPSLLVPRSVYKLRKANHNFMLWFVKFHSGTGGGRKLLGQYILPHKEKQLLFRIVPFVAPLVFLPLCIWRKPVTHLLCKWKEGCNCDQKLWSPSRLFLPCMHFIFMQMFKTKQCIERPQLTAGERMLKQKPQ